MIQIQFMAIYIRKSYKFMSFIYVINFKTYLFILELLKNL